MAEAFWGHALPQVHPVLAIGMAIFLAGSVLALVGQLVYFVIRGFPFMRDYRPIDPNVNDVADGPSSVTGTRY